jgi:hypothetical protein
MRQKNKVTSWIYGDSSNKADHSFIGFIEQCSVEKHPKYFWKYDSSVEALLKFAEALEAIGIKE